MEEILGQARAVSLLQSGVSSGRLHHAYIFHGPAGVGKFTTALAFARLILCEAPRSSGQGAAACGRCPSCRLAQPGRRAPAAAPQRAPAADDAPRESSRAHPDLHVVTRDLARFSDDADARKRKLTNIPVEVLRQFLLEPVHRTAQLKHGKVFVVDEAELMDERGQNLLLKTLEEPPPATHVVLVTSRPERLLPTLRSRCQRVAFGPLPDSVVGPWVDRAAPGLAAAQRSWLLGFAGGSLGRAALAVRYNLAAWAGLVLGALEQIERGGVAADLGKGMAGLIDDFAEAWMKDQPAPDQASKEAANRLAVGLLLQLLCQHARQKLGAAAQQAGGDDPSAVERGCWPWLSIIEAARLAEAEVASNLNLGLVCDQLAVNLHAAMTPGARAVSAAML